MNQVGEKRNIQYSLWIGNNRTIERTITLNVPANISFYRVMEFAAGVDNKYRFEYNMRNGKPYVFSISDTQDDPENGMMWHLFEAVSDSEGDLKPITKTGVKNGRSLQGKLTDGTVVEIEAGASFYTDPSSDTTSGCFYPRSNHWEVGGRPQCDKCGCRVRNCSQHRFTTLETISNYRNSYPGFSSGRPRGTTPADDRYIVLQARRNRRQTAGEIARHTTQATGRPISRFTVARRLHGGGLFARRPVRCVPLTPAHRRRRSLWCREHRNWRDNEWGRVLFTDESRFNLSSDSHRILIWRERGSRNHPSNIIERDRYGGRGVLVWEGIMLGSRTDLHMFDAGSVNGTRYCNEILLPYVRLFRGAMGLQFLFMDDNAPCHRTVAAEQLLESRRLAARTLPPGTIRELRLALQDEWAAMPQQLIDTLILSMGRRCETCLAVRGDHIPY
ncbi:transposable element Tcb2 transposase [Trichonephila clavipes]|uniref:Transposable element Tcb2 transposase n=1 Tax=Trichonephila clavipes TaxID=2585209 RepID=A0A8X6T2I7_TRICX|nr:transposable element Tcb2 transposase [Trichonephila clavipes]